MDVRDLPHLNAGLNAVAATLLGLGWWCIRRRKVDAHRRLMTAAFLTSVLFLVSYVVYHARAGSVRFPGTGAARAAYLGLLASHVVLAAAVPPLAVATLWLARRGDFERHRRVARVAWPVWMYVSVTGVIVYVLLYHVYRPA